MLYVGKSSLFSFKMWNKRVSVNSKILKLGYGITCPLQRSECKVLLESSHQDLIKLEKLLGCKFNEKVVLKVGNGKDILTDILDKFLEKMHCESQIEIDVKFLENFKNFVVGGNVTFSLTLFEFTQAIPLYELNITQCISIAAEFKETGTDFFKQNNFDVAAKFYSKALKYILVGLTCENIPTEDKGNAESMLAVLHSNLAACQLKHGCFLKVVQNCTDSIAINPNSVKTLYRRATALIELKNYDLAHSDIKNALLLEPQNTAILALKSKLKKKNTFEKSELSQNLKTMFV